MCRNPSPVRSGIGGCKRASRGFLLVEVLVSIVIISIGLLGLAGLHAVAMAKGNSGLLRSKATQLGYAMADRIRVNLIASSAGAYTSMTPQSSLTDPGCISVNCTPAQLAVSDYVEWNTEIANALPQGAGVVCVDSTPDDGTPAAPACDGLGSVVVVKVFWSEKPAQGQTTPQIFVFSTPVRPS
jgi:type IV pilus assembly protein PilV